MAETATSSDGWVCVDCALLISNGDLPDHMTETELADWLDAMGNDVVTLGRSFAECGHSADDYDEHATYCEVRDFSWSACDSCHSALGGARYAATFWE